VKLYSLFIYLFLIGCVSAPINIDSPHIANSYKNIPIAPIKDDIIAKQFRPTLDKANIYLYRDSTIYIMSTLIRLDDKLIGEMMGQTYMKIPVEPGLHNVYSKGVDGVSVLQLYTEANKNYFIWDEQNLSGHKLRQVPKFRAKNTIMPAKLVEIQ
jgi:hypothetical protein